MSDDSEATVGSERAALVAEVGDCCDGQDPFCAGGCLVERALKKRGEASNPIAEYLAEKRPITDETALDRNVEAVRQRLRDRAESGLKKYGVTTERTDLSFVEWVQHLQDELLDAAVYAERLKQTEPAPLEQERGALSAELQKWRKEALDQRLRANWLEQQRDAWQITATAYKAEFNARARFEDARHTCERIEKQHADALKEEA